MLLICCLASATIAAEPSQRAIISSPTVPADPIMSGSDCSMPSWKMRARRELIDLRGSSRALGYRSKHAPSPEPTAIACLALLATGYGATSTSDLAICHQAAAWMAAMQQPDGSLRAAGGVAVPEWSAPYALLLWSALHGYDERESRALSWLMSRQGTTQRISRSEDNVIGHNPSLVGWPWVEGTHSWLEPTAMAILALNREGLADHPRVAAGQKLIVDRALKAGGWNYGNKAAFGTELRPQPGPTGLALLALAACGDRSAAVSRGIEYLRAKLPELRAPVSLGWCALGLRAHQAVPARAESSLEESHARCTGKLDAAMGLGLLLLASSERALSLLISPASGRAGRQPESR
jgi:hypothetical protein